MALLAEPILRLLFPGSSEGAYLLTISALGIIFMGLTQTLSGVLQGLGHVFVPALSLFTGAAVKIILNLILMPLPHINIRGAAYGTLACYIVAAAINAAVLNQKFRLNLNIYHFIIKPVAATFFMGVAAAFIFGLFILLLGGVDAEDISALPFGENVSKALLKTRIIRF